MKERGQGLVEMALILPFLLVLIVGIVEVGAALNRQLVVVNAAREGARFGAVGATPDDIHGVVLSSALQLDFTEGDTVIVVIQAEVDEDGAAFDEWEVTSYPEGAIIPHVTPEGVLADLRGGGGVGLVIVDIEYDHRSILGFPFVSALADRIPVGSWTVMRLEPCTR